MSRKVMSKELHKIEESINKACAATQREIINSVHLKGAPLPDGELAWYMYGRAEGHRNGYRDALDDVLLPLGGVTPDRDPYWKRES